MEKFTNPNILKEKKRLTRNVLLSILLLIAAIALAAFGYYMVEQAKAKKEMYEEIWNTIIAKNNRIVLGFTKEAQQEAKERIER